VTLPILLVKGAQEKLKPAEEGLYEYKGMRFILTVEISTVFRRENSIKKVHHVLHAPSIDTAVQVNDILSNMAT